MKNYTLRTNGRTYSPQWSYDFNTDSDQEAIENVKRVLESDWQHANWVISFLLFTTDQGDGTVSFNYDRFVAEFRIGQTIINVKEWRND